LAYVQALSIKITQPTINQYAVIVDKETAEKITNKHRRVFDHIIILENDYAKDESWKLSNEWQAFNLTPFYETIKVESDILFPVSIESWWPGLQQYEVLFTSNVLDYEGNVSPCRTYRRIQDLNNLPDIYTGLMYFRYSRTATLLFDMAREVYEHWDLFCDEILREVNTKQATTDEVFSIAARLIGDIPTYTKQLSFPTFAHMKGGIQGWGTNTQWTKNLRFNLHENGEITCGFNRQFAPFHYFYKEFIREDIISLYESLYEKKCQRNQ